MLADLVHLDPLLVPALVAIGVVPLGAVVLTGVIHAIRRLPVNKLKELGLKLLVMVSVVLVVVIAGGVGRLALVPLLVAVGAACWKELLGAVASRPGAAVALPGGASAIGAASILFGLVHPTLGGACLAALAAAWGSLLLPILVTRRPPPLAGFLATGFGAVLITLPLALFLAMGKLSFGAYAFLFMVVSTHDGCANWLGRLGGRHKNWPEISPGKTWEGSIGGCLLAIAGGCAVRFLVPTWTLPQVAGLATTITIFAELGDVVASALKCEAGVKDFGTLLPLQGGLLDRFDSLLFTAPVYFVLLALHGDWRLF